RRFVLRALPLDRFARALEARSPHGSGRPTLALLPNLVELLIERKHLFEQRGRRSRARWPSLGAIRLRRSSGRRVGARMRFELEPILDAARGILQCSVGIVEIRGPLEARPTLGRRRVVEVVGMKLPAQRAVALFEIGHVDIELVTEAKKAEEVSLQV